MCKSIQTHASGTMPGLLRIQEFLPLCARRMAREVIPTHLFDAGVRVELAPRPRSHRTTLMGEGEHIQARRMGPGEA